MKRKYILFMLMVSTLAITSCGSDKPGLLKGSEEIDLFSGNNQAQLDSFSTSLKRILTAYNDLNAFKISTNVDKSSLGIKSSFHHYDEEGELKSGETEVAIKKLECNVEAGVTNIATNKENKFSDVTGYLNVNDLDFDFTGSYNFDSGLIPNDIKEEYGLKDKNDFDITASDIDLSMYYKNENLYGDFSSEGFLQFVEDILDTNIIDFRKELGVNVLDPIAILEHYGLSTKIATSFPIEGSFKLDKVNLNFISSFINAIPTNEDLLKVFSALNLKTYKFDKDSNYNYAISLGFSDSTQLNSLAKTIASIYFGDDTFSLSTYLRDKGYSINKSSYLLIVALNEKSGSIAFSIDHNLDIAYSSFAKKEETKFKQEELQDDIKVNYVSAGQITSVISFPRKYDIDIVIPSDEELETYSVYPPIEEEEEIILK